MKTLHSEFGPIIYTCESCGNVSVNKHTIEHCERVDNCTHINSYYFNGDKISVSCKACYSLLLEDMPLSNLSQTHLKKVYDLIKELKGE